MKKLLAVLAVFMLGTFYVSAQKFGHLDYIAVMDSLETYKVAIKKSEEVQNDFEETMKFLQDDYQKKALDYQNGIDTMPDILRQMREQELYQIQALSEQKQAEYQQSLEIIQTRYFVKLEEWLKKSVGTVGERKGLDYILYYDEENSIFWVNPNKGVDVTNEVITEMLKVEAAEGIPGE